ncbi:hypothetical protein BLA29_009172 [Euroglyphus maynei]|uniref:Immunoglobulin I-set domain-containing protein n=1 Tax=Euroglyphus maynei TaxID=6958 RepID=A0A1Y3BQ66_EURMA|nr:hypothetical protein BLA29_009172 [Euroglyphus maynei]
MFVFLFLSLFENKNKLIPDVQEQNITKVIIESVNANHRGRYQCMAINQQGMSRSNTIQLDVQCKANVFSN